ncbi:MAG: hypothetical protein COV07_01040 [Candidatus Vogelbacteria bacterium CG10_big_fil_rev_8_21_14_0_10_45_14]|uniref:DUF7282 domain-containing protein n=1 Tax=Candidatus Vogelbacteria bacterium CG10_big_fil_rev_8_21_14_0_10_45_14 TaxID=1975042 RepID=A0A2H0RKG3_9BACT|nr:MAG: hypothetical protein COV07_01040 [Candidatus Vogelbacteria bacterium CG10_big_fil_rev_8_21_14_0_10_45_14]
MSETNKVILAAVLGILVGFWGGRLLDNRPLPLDDDELDGKEEMMEDEEADTASVGSVVPAKTDDMSVKESDKTKENAVDISIQTTPATSGSMMASVSVGNQMAGSKVMTVAKTGATTWVVVHEDRNGEPGNILGARRVEAGTTTTEVMLLRGTVAGGKYYVMLHSDNGDGKFDYKLDLPILEGGMAVMSSFVAM